MSLKNRILKNSAINEAPAGVADLENQLKILKSANGTKEEAMNLVQDYIENLGAQGGARIRNEIMGREGKFGGYNFSDLPGSGPKITQNAQEIQQTATAIANDTITPTQEAKIEDVVSSIPDSSREVVQQRAESSGAVPQNFDWSKFWNDPVQAVGGLNPMQIAGIIGLVVGGVGLFRAIKNWWKKRKNKKESNKVLDKAQSEFSTVRSGDNPRNADFAPAYSIKVNHPKLKKFYSVYTNTMKRMGEKNEK